MLVQQHVYLLFGSKVDGRDVALGPDGRNGRCSERQETVNPKSSNRETKLSR